MDEILEASPAAHDERTADTVQIDQAEPPVSRLRVGLGDEQIRVAQVAGVQAGRVKASHERGQCAYEAAPLGHRPLRCPLAPVGVEPRIGQYRADVHAFPYDPRGAAFQDGQRTRRRKAQQTQAVRAFPGSVGWGTVQKGVRAPAPGVQPLPLDHDRHLVVRHEHHGRGGVLLEHAAQLPQPRACGRQVHGLFQGEFGVDGGGGDGAVHSVSFRRGLHIAQVLEPLFDVGFFRRGHDGDVRGFEPIASDSFNAFPKRAGNILVVCDDIFMLGGVGDNVI